MLQTGQSNVITDNWHHVAFSFDSSSSNLLLFVDGILKNSSNVNIDTSSIQLSNIILGSNIDGSIDNVKIFNTALDTEQIQYLASSGNYNNSLQNNIVDLKFNDNYHTPAFDDVGISSIGDVGYSNGFIQGSKAIDLNNGYIQVNSDGFNTNELSFSAWVNLTDLDSTQHIAVSDGVSDGFDMFLNTSNISLKLGGVPVTFTPIDDNTPFFTGERLKIDFNSGFNDTSYDAKTNNVGVVSTDVAGGSFSNDILSYPNASFYADKITLSSWVKTSNGGTLFNINDNLDVNVNNSRISVDVGVSAQSKELVSQLNSTHYTVINKITSFNGEALGSLIQSSGNVEFDIVFDSLKKFQVSEISFNVPFRNHSPTNISVLGIDGGSSVELINENIAFRNKQYIYKIRNSTIETPYNTIKVRVEGGGVVKMSDIQLGGYLYSYIVAYAGQDDISSVSSATELLTFDGQNTLTINLNAGVTVNAILYNIIMNKSVNLGAVSDGFTITIPITDTGEYFLRITDAGGVSYDSNKVAIETRSVIKSLYSKTYDNTGVLVHNWGNTFYTTTTNLGTPTTSMSFGGWVDLTAGSRQISINDDSTPLSGYGWVGGPNDWHIYIVTHSDGYHFTFRNSRDGGIVDFHNVSHNIFKYKGSLTHLVITTENNNITIYTNGRKMQTKTWTTSNSYSNFTVRNFLLGYYGANQGANHCFSQMFFYKGTIGDDDVKKIYNGEVPKSTTSGAELKCYFPFNSNLNDASGNGNNLVESYYSTAPRWTSHNIVPFIGMYPDVYNLQSYSDKLYNSQTTYQGGIYTLCYDNKLFELTVDSCEVGSNTNLRHYDPARVFNPKNSLNNTAWKTGNHITFPHYMTVKLPETKYIDKMFIRERESNGGTSGASGNGSTSPYELINSWSIEAKTESGSWTTVYSGTGIGHSGKEVTLTSPGTYQYWRIKVSSVHNKYSGNNFFGIQYWDIIARNFTRSETDINTLAIVSYDMKSEPTTSSESTPYASSGVTFTNEGAVHAGTTSNFNFTFTTEIADTFSISFMAKGLHNSQSGFISSSSTGGAPEFEAYLAGTTYVAFKSRNVGWDPHYIKIDTTEFTHYVFVHSPAMRALYIDGSLIHADVLPNGAQLNEKTFFASTKNMFAAGGILKDFKAFNNILDEHQIKELYFFDTTSLSQLEFDGYNKLTIKNPPDELEKITLTHTDVSTDVGTATTMYITEPGLYKVTIKSSNSMSTIETEALTINTFRTVPQVSSSIFGSLVLTENGELYGWGDADTHKVVPGTGKTAYPQKIDTGTIKIKKFVSGGYNAMAMDDNENLYLWGANHYGSLAEQDATIKRNFTTTPLSKLLYNNEKIINIFGGDRTYGILTRSSKLQFPTYNDSIYGNVGNYVLSEQVPYDTIPFKDLHKNDYITYAFFIKLTSNNTWRFILATENYFKNGRSNGNNNYSLQITNEKKLSLRTQDGTIDLIYDTALSDATWYHVAVIIPLNSVKDVTDNIIYVNGVKVAEKKSTSTYTNNISEDVLLSKQPSWSTTNTGIDGYIHDLRVYNTQLSADDILNLNNKTSISTTPTVYIDFNDDDNSIHQYHPNSKLYNWGWNTHTQLGNSTKNSSDNEGNYIPTEVPKPSDGYWVYFASGHRHNQFISSKGDLYTAGYDGGYNMLGRNASGAWSNGIAKISISTHGRIIRSADGQYGAVFLNDKNQLYTYGNNRTGEAGRSSRFGVNYGNGIALVESTFDSEIVDITKSHNDTKVLTNSGGHYTFGEQSYSSFGNPLITVNTRYQATLCDIPNVIAMNNDGYGGSPIIVTRDGHVYTFGYNEIGGASGVKGNLGTGNTTQSVVKEPMKVYLPEQNGYLMALKPVVKHSKNTLHITGIDMKKTLYKDGVALDNVLDNHQISETGDYHAGVQNGEAFFFTDTVSVNEITIHSSNGESSESSSIDGLVTKVNFSTLLTNTGTLGNNVRKVIGTDDNGNNIDAIGASHGRSDFELRYGYFLNSYRRACVRVTESSGPTRHISLMSNAPNKNSITSIIASSGAYTASYVFTGLGFFGYMTTNFGGGFTYVANGDFLHSSYGNEYKRPNAYGTKTMYVRVSMSSDTNDAANINKATLLIMDIKTKETHIREFTNMTNKNRSSDRLFYFNMAGGFAQYNGSDGPDYGYDISNIVIRDKYMNQPEIPSDDLIVGFSNVFWNNFLSSDNLRLIPPIGYNTGLYKITEGSPDRTGSRTSYGGATYKMNSTNVFKGNDTSYVNENMVLYINESTYANGQYYFKCNYETVTSNILNNIYSGLWITNNNNQVDIYICIPDIRTIAAYSLLYSANNPATYSKTITDANNTYASKSWDLYASNDNKSWILLHSGSELHNTTDTSYTHYTISKFNSFKFFKFSFKTFKNGSYFSISGIQLFEGLPTISYDNLNKITTSLLPSGTCTVIHNGVETNIGSATGVIINEPGTYQIKGTDGKYYYTTNEIVVPEFSGETYQDITSFLSDITMGYDGTWFVTNTSSVYQTNALSYSNTTNRHNAITTVLPNGNTGSVFHLNAYNYDSASFDVSKDITAEATIKLPDGKETFDQDYHSLNGVYPYVIIEIGGNGFHSYAVSFNSSGSLCVYSVEGSNYANTSTTPIATSTFPLSTTGWNHIVFSISSTTGKVYLNGSEIMSFTNNKSSTMGGTIMNFRDMGGGGHGNLYIYNFRTYDKELSQSEVTQRYNFLTTKPDPINAITQFSSHPKVKATSDGTTSWASTTTTAYSKESAQQIHYKTVPDNLQLSVFNGYNGAGGFGWQIFSGDTNKYTYYHTFAHFYLTGLNRSTKFVKSLSLWYTYHNTRKITHIKYQKDPGAPWITVVSNGDFGQYSILYKGTNEYYAEIPINLTVYNLDIRLDGSTNYYWHPRECEFNVVDSYLLYPEYTTPNPSLEYSDSKLKIKHVPSDASLVLIKYNIGGNEYQIEAGSVREFILSNSGTYKLIVYGSSYFESNSYEFTATTNVTSYLSGLSTIMLSPQSGVQYMKSITFKTNNWVSDTKGVWGTYPVVADEPISWIESETHKYILTDMGIFKNTTTARLANGSNGMYSSFSNTDSMTSEYNNVLIEMNSAYYIDYIQLWDARSDWTFKGYDIWAGPQIDSMVKIASTNHTPTTYWNTYNNTNSSNTTINSIVKYIEIRNWKLNRVGAIGLGELRIYGKGLAIV